MPDEAWPTSPEPERDGQPAPPEGLVLVSTPIGNLGDLTPRARETLRAADLILCEDTRHTARLLAAIGVRAKLQPLHEHNEDASIPAVLEMLRRGRRVALVSDAGVPLVSDPGYRLVRAAIAEGVTIGVVPGPNAGIAALVLSGLPPLPFLLLGFPPPRQAARRAGFGSIRAAERAGLSATLIWYEAPHRLAIVVGPPEQDDPEDLDGRLRAALAINSLKDAAALVATATGLPRKLVYARALALSAGRPP